MVGGGISGLTVAYRLGQSMPESQVTLVEQSHRLGGKLETERYEGFVMDHGPDVFLSRKPWAVDLCKELGLELQPTNPQVKGSFIQQGGRLHPLPDGFGGLVPSSWVALARTSLLTARGKARLALEALVPASRGSDDESLGAFARRRLGAEAYDRLIHPLLGGIYGGDIEALSLEATFPQFRQMEREHGSLIRAARARARGAKGAAARATAAQATAAGGRAKAPLFYTLRDGMQSLPDGLAAACPAQVRLGMSATSIDVAQGAGPKSTRVLRVHLNDRSSLEADAVICTTPAYAAADVLASHRELAEILRAIPYNSSLIVTLAFGREQVPHPLDGYGYLIPASEGKAVRACTWTSTKIPGRAPTGEVLIRVFFGRSADDPWLEASDEQLLECAAEELKATLGIEDGPKFHRVRRWIRGQPAYTMGHPERLRLLDDALGALPGLFLTGSAYRGVGIPDCIRQANKTALSVTNYLKA
ncbi:MAG: oxygen-dependent protoporphyrinogen oxidase [Rhodothermales bacterium]